MYESYYGLESKPFQLTADPAFFYASPWHKRAMSYLQYGLSQAEGFIVITGGIGTGKTTIANSLLDEIEDDIVAAQIVTPKLSPDELVKMVAVKFELNVDGKTKADILKDLEKFLETLHKQGKRALLLVDEAQNLPLETIEELRMLSNFQKMGKPLLQSFLLGQEELQPILRAPNMEQFRQRIVASCHLSALNEEESKSYIECRLYHAGWSGNALITEQGYEHIHDFTKGIPRKINLLMDRVLLFGFLEELELLDEKAIDAVIEEVRGEMFEPQYMDIENESAALISGIEELTGDPSFALSLEGERTKNTSHYKDLLTEIVDILDNSISHKIKLIQYIDKILKKKHAIYNKLKEGNIEIE